VAAVLAGPPYDLPRMRPVSRIYGDGGVSVTHEDIHRIAGIEDHFRRAVTGLGHEARGTRDRFWRSQLGKFCVNAEKPQRANPSLVTV